ncbi:MAG TPA: alanine racemase [Terriglobales bacterium]|nr:alanine racemase [Terriglobales bacterium]
MNAPRPDLSRVPERRSLILDGRTWAEVSLEALRENFHTVQKHIGEGVTICAVVKADGYGHGAIECARALESTGALWLGVTDAAEGLALRSSGVNARILLMTGIWKGEEESIVAQNLTPTIWEHWHIESLERAARQRHGVLPVHLKIDTGMNRLGASLEALPRLCEMLMASKHLTLEGVSTHFASAEVLDAEDARRQMKRFEDGLAIVRSYGLRPGLLHMGNSAAMSARPETWKTMVRPGIALYGYSLAFTRGGEPAAITPLPLRPVLSWKTRVLTVKEVAAGEAVGYMGTFVTKARSRIAVLPVGYADGYPRLLSNRARVIVGGEYAPVVGRISMDLTIVDVSELRDVAVGDEVILIGATSGKSVDAVELARLCESVPYEILCGLSQRVPRVYIGL